MAKACVIGSINMDVILNVKEAPKPGEAILAQQASNICGGKGENAAIALSKLGVSTMYYGCVGKDEYGSILMDNLKKYNIHADLVKVNESNTGVAYIILEENGENRIIVNPGANESISRMDIRKDCQTLIEEADLVLIQLEIAKEAIIEIIQICKEMNKKLVIDAGPVRGWRAEELAGAYCVSPNETELEALIGRKLTTHDEILEGGKELLRYGIQNVLLKRGSSGSMLINEEEVIEMGSYQVDVVDTTAAGDSYTAGFCKKLMEEVTMEEAMEYATKCGAIAVTRYGACPSLPSWEEVEAFEEFLA